MRSFSIGQYAVAAVLFFGGVMLLLNRGGIVYVSRERQCTPQTKTKSPETESVKTSMQNAFNEERKTVLFQQSFSPMSFKTNKSDSFDYKSEMQKLNDAKVSQDDPRLIQLIRDYYIIPPTSLPLDLKEDKLDYSMGQAPFVDSRLNYVENGFYVECGALDGETRSNTLFFEKVRKWNGLLIEGDPSNVEKILKKHRKAFVINACLNTQPYPSKRTFNAAFNMGRIADTDEAGEWVKKKRLRQRPVEVQCFPLYSILLAINQLRVDYFSLDVEGDELGVLKTIPWDKLTIAMMSVEFVHDKEGADGLKSYVQKSGYDALVKVTRFDNLANDIIFRKKGLH